ncbi:MAG: ABC transporter permease subunit [Candidatus Latescibacterota bacterium]|jgi:ABC-type transport system involved in multi-copper enzyme maturation permease subunit
MLLHLVRKELLDHLLSLRFAIACGVCLLVFLLSSLVLVRDYREAASTYAMNQVVHRNAVLQTTEIQGLWEGVNVDRPPNPLSILVRGLMPQLTESVKVQFGGNLDFAEAYEQNPVIPLFPQVDFVFGVGIVMSLLALAFGYDAVAGERESGVLKVLMSYPVPRDLVLLGKWLGGYLALVAPFLVAFLASLVLMVLFPEVQPTSDTTLGVLALLGLALLYLAAIYSLGLLVSCRVSLSSTAITVLLLIWVVLILALPNMAPYVAARITPIPSRESVERERVEVQQAMQKRAEAMWREEMQRSGGRGFSVSDSLRAKFEAMQKEAEAAVQKVEDSYAAKLAGQSRLAGVVARLSPLASFELTAFDLAGAGIDQERRFVESLKTYGKTWQEYSEKKQEAWRRYIEQKQKESKDGMISFNMAEMNQFNKLDLGDYPRYGFAYMPFGDRLGLAWGDLLLLLVWNVVFFMLAYLSFVRRDVQ